MTTTELNDVWRPIFDRRASKADGHTFAGIEYDWELAGPGGASYVLFPAKGTPQEQIEKAKSACRNHGDVVGPIRVVHVPQEWLDSESWEPSESPSTWVDAARWVVEHGACRRVDVETGQLVPENRRGGVLLDTFSASGMVKVYDALSAENQAKLASLDVCAAQGLVFKLLNKMR